MAAPPDVSDGEGGGGDEGAAGGKGEKASSYSCNICFEEASEPVVTLCGHLYCWPCLYQWLHKGNGTCPVCKSVVSKTNVIPIYGRGVEGAKGATDAKAPPRPRGRSEMGARREEGRRGSGEQGAPGINISFGTFPSIFGLQFQSFAEVGPRSPRMARGVGVSFFTETGLEAEHQRFLSAVLVTLSMLLCAFILFV